jgi:hypothetical protein
MLRRVTTGSEPLSTWQSRVGRSARIEHFSVFLETIEKALAGESASYSGGVPGAKLSTARVMIARAGRP